VYNAVEEKNPRGPKRTDAHRRTGKGIYIIAGNFSGSSHNPLSVVMLKTNNIAVMNSGSR